MRKIIAEYIGSSTSMHFYKQNDKELYTIKCSQREEDFHWLKSEFHALIGCKISDIKINDSEAFIELDNWKTYKISTYGTDVYISDYQLRNFYHSEIKKVEISCNVGIIDKFDSPIHSRLYIYTDKGASYIHFFGFGISGKIRISRRVTYRDLWDYGKEYEKFVKHVK